jgi:hypothetical protein
VDGVDPDLRGEFARVGVREQRDPALRGAVQGVARLADSPTVLETLTIAPASMYSAAAFVPRKTPLRLTPIRTS